MSKADLLQESNENLLSFGQYGHRILSAAETSVSGEYFAAVTVLQAAVIDYTSEPTVSGGDTTISNLTIPAGITIYGKLKDITVDSGEVIAYLM